MFDTLHDLESLQRRRRNIAKFGRKIGLSRRPGFVSRVAQPALDNPGKAIAGVAAVAAAIGAGIWAGLALRRKRLSTYHSPYESRRFRKALSESGEYEAVGI